MIHDILQYVAEVAYDMVSPGPSVRQKRYYRRQRRAAQPADLRQGVSNAYHVVKEVTHGSLHIIYLPTCLLYRVKGYVITRFAVMATLMSWG